MLAPDAAKEIAKFSLSVYTIARRIDDISADIESKFWKRCASVKILHYSLLSLRTSAAMLNFWPICFVDGDAIREKFLFCKALQKKQWKRKYFRSQPNILSKEDLRGNCICVCTDGARKCLLVV